MMAATARAIRSAVEWSRAEAHIWKKSRILPLDLLAVTCSMFALTVRHVTKERGAATMDRRRFLHSCAASALLRPAAPFLAAPAISARAAPSHARVRPGQPGWPSDASWERLREAVGGRLIKVASPLDACRQSPSSAECAQLLKQLKNPYFLGDEVGLTQSLGWVGGWTSSPSAYAIAAETAS
jgi:hypothetical protein